MIDLSVLVPVFNERENLAPLFDELAAALAPLEGLSWEVVFVDDGSRDGSRDVLAALAARDPAHVRVVELARNYGQTAAIDAGLRRARGAVLVPIDADRQNDPADIPRLLAEVARGADCVSGWRRRRQDPLWSRRLPSWLANRLLARLTGVPIHDFGCTLKAYRREVLADVRLMGEMHRFVPAYAAWNGARVVELEVHHRARTWGRSKYGIWRTFKVVLDLMTVLFLQSGYAARPLHLFGGAGLALVALALALACVTLWQKGLYPLEDARHVFVHRNPITALAALLCVLGAGAVALGLLAELLARVYHATGGTTYRLAGGRNVEGLATPEEARALPPALAALAARPPTGPA